MLNRAFSVSVAFFVSIGIHYTWTASAGGGHTLALQIPTLSALALGVWHWLNQYAMQETLHQVTSKNGGINVAAQNAKPAVTPGRGTTV